MWRRLKINSSDRRTLALCRALAAYREEEARRLNRPRKHIMRDEILIEIATNAPRTADELNGLRGVPNGFANSRTGREILIKIHDVLASDPSTYPELPKPFELPRHARAVAKMLKLLLMIKSAESGVAEKLIANFDDLDKLAAGKAPDSPLLSGWRYEVFGKAAELLKAGKIGFAYNPEKCRIDLIETK